MEIKHFMFISCVRINSKFQTNLFNVVLTTTTLIIVSTEFHERELYLLCEMIGLKHFKDFTWRAIKLKWVEFQFSWTDLVMQSTRKKKIHQIWKLSQCQNTYKIDSLYYNHYTSVLIIIDSKDRQVFQG
jgi:hypothetical protein